MYLEKFKQLKSSKEFKKLPKEYFLCSCFLIIGKDWQFDFFSKKTGKMISFIVNDEIKRQEDKPFSKDKSKIKILDLKKVKIKYEDALKKAQSYYPKEIANKEIIILQSSSEPIWNVTLITNTLNVINVKSSAVTGKLVSKTRESVLRFKSQ
ncbi:hypothetical protein K8R47_02875 [archaeon]|nr:hypothetical protein [archaeon]